MAINYFGALQGIGQAIILLLIAAAIGLCIAVLLIIMSYKHKVRIREVTKTRTRVIDDRAKQVKAKDGTYWWKLLKMHRKVTIPPDNAKDLTKKGKIVAEAYLINGTDFVWADTDFDIDYYKAGVKQGFKPFNTQQRALLVAEYEQAEAYRKTPLSEMIMKAMPYIALIMILTVFMIFFGEVTAPVKELSMQQEQTAKQMTELVSKMDDVINSKTTIKQELPAGVVQVNNLPPGGEEP